MKAADLREKNLDELAELRKTAAHEVFENRLKNFTNRLDDTSAIRKNRRDLARLLTVIRQREIAAAAAGAKSVQATGAVKPAAATKNEAKS